MRPRALLLLVAAAIALAFSGCPEPAPTLAYKLEQQTDLPRPPTADAPGLTSDLVPPGFSSR